ncbi:MAG: sporulation protein [Gracilibacter sp. BRH_c7a]|nr:MAG: sporulation protein [Gracilibacter sp. BRH_c7a]
MLSMVEYSKRVFIAVVIIIATMVVPYVIYRVFPHFTPFILAYFTALLLDPLGLWLRKNFKLNKLASVTITNLLFLGGIGLLGYFIISKIYVQLVGLLTYIQNNSATIQTWILGISRDIQSTIRLLPYETAAQINSMIINAINDLANLNLVSQLGAYTINLSTAIPNIFFIVLIYLISVFLFNMQLDNIHRRFYSFFKDSSRRKVIYIIGDLKKATFGFLKAQGILSIVTFLLAFIGLIILRVDYAALISLFVVLVDVLPILGVGSAFTPWIIVAALQGNLFLALGLAILLMVIIVVRRVIEPKILGERIGLGALATLVSIWIGFKVMGIIGIFLLPLAFIFYKALVKVGVINIDRFRF